MLFQRFGQRTYLLSRYTVINEDYGVFISHTCLFVLKGMYSLHDR